MEVVVTDANIFIDLCKTMAAEAFFSLPVKIHTTRYIIDELISVAPQMRQFIDENLLIIKDFGEDEYENLLTFSFENSDTNLSLPDCSALFYAMENGFKLLTGDMKLRKRSEKYGVDVSGVLWVFDKISEYGVLSPEVLKEKLILLKKINKRLPFDEIDKRINKL